jgi:hypothetical protein
MVKMKALSLITFFRKQENQPLLALLSHLVLLATLYITAVALFGNRLPLLSNARLRHWDAEWYFRIKKTGYEYIAGKQGTLAFFPLFPFLWKFTGLNEIGVSLLNLVMFLVSFLYLARTLKIGFTSSLLFLSTPSLIFCFIPYSEALFFMSSTIILIGLYKRSDPMIILGICLAGFSRSVNIVLIPALAFTYVLNYGFSFKTIRVVLMATIFLAAAAMTVFWIQYLYTGKWLVFFDMQRQWHRSLQMPTLPLTTLSTKVLWLDVIALFISTLALFDAAAEFIHMMFGKEKASFGAATHFSMAYLSIMGLLAVFYSGIWPGQQGSSIMSINRFVFAGPFFISYVCGRSAKARTMQSRLIFLLALLVTLFAAGAYKKLSFLAGYPLTIGYFAAIALYITLYFRAFEKEALKLFFYAINATLMVLLLFDFLGYGWVG